MNSLERFSIARLPRIEFGSGVFARTGEIVAGYGKRVLLVTGAQSFHTSNHWQSLSDQFVRLGLSYESVNIPSEPSPQMVDQAVSDFADADIDVVLGVGGGSALDAAKAIAGLLRVKQSVLDFLEGVGPELPYTGPAVPFIAVPTTAGTGSEATKNAVLSQPGANGFKKSFRHDKLVAEIAIVDPDLLASCPATIIAANGMDALTQLIESYVSIRANEFTDALGFSGLRAARDGLLALYRSAGQDARAREQMAYASLISGINLAQTGLGSVHGLASPLGAFYPIPHGVVCGTLVAPATRINIDAMLEREPDSVGLERYARVAEVLLQKHFSDRDAALQALVELLHDWTGALHLQRLSEYGVEQAQIDHVVAHARGSSMKTNPIVLTDEEIRLILLERL
ncbi:MAG: iron-containing alcohol dehydrogenase [Chromatiales bacterium]|jgi:alcohol dehydrogenase